MAEPKLAAMPILSSTQDHLGSLEKRFDSALAESEGKRIGTIETEMDALLERITTFAGRF